MLKTIELPSVALLPEFTPQSTEDDLAASLRTLIEQPDLDRRLDDEVGLEEKLIHSARTIARKAYPSNRTTDRQSAGWIDHDSRDALHRALLVIYQQHVRLPTDSTLVNQFHPLVCRLMHELEKPWEKDMLRRMRATHDLSESALPSDAEQFAAWFNSTAFAHPLYEHDLYTFIACEASRAQLEWFFRMECAGEAAFDDLVAMGQVGTRGSVKMEMASNYWDEMGRGRAHAVHTHLFYNLIDSLKVEAPPASELPWQVLAGVNVMLWSCIPRRNAFRAQGTLGAVELLAPQRCTRVVHGAKRVGIRKKAVVYYGAHAIIDIGHAEGWLANVVKPQVAAHPQARVGIAEGLLARADASLDYFDYCLATARSFAG
ncbi:MAG TPA: iron-containing redox enzyme family protein [Gemmatimonadaceae bacterium]